MEFPFAVISPDIQSLCINNTFSAYFIYLLFILPKNSLLPGQSSSRTDLQHNKMYVTLKVSYVNMDVYDNKNIFDFLQYEM